MPANDLLKTKTLDVSIATSPDRVYRFVSNPVNLPRWASGLGASVEKRGEAWIVHTPSGAVELAFCAPNALGVLDHLVTLNSGEDVLNPMRVIPNGSGSTVLFTVLQRSGMTDVEFATDAASVARDLETLKGILEMPEA